MRRRSSVLSSLAIAACAIAPAGAAPASKGPASDGPSIVYEVNVVDVINGSVLPSSVVVRGGLIDEVRSGWPRTGFPRDESVVDARRKFLIPGLWDMHAHVRDPERELPLLVANGVLGIRDMGGEPGAIFRLRQRVTSGELLGPRIVACGPIVDGPEPSNPPISIPVHDAAGARQVVRSLKEMGADCVKVHDRVSREAYLALAEEARKVGLPLVGHVPVRVRTMEATSAGQRSIEHQIGLRGMSTAENEVMQSEKRFDSVAEAMRTGDFTIIPEMIAKRGVRLLDTVDAGRADALYRAFAKHGTCLVPTLVTLEALAFVDDHSQVKDDRMRYIPDAERQYWRPEKGLLTRYRTPAYIAYRKREFGWTLKQIPVAQKAGVTFLAGTDMSLPYVYPGFSVHDEMALFVQAGLTPADALRTATLNPVRFLGLDDTTGSIQKGRAADFVILDADPLRDIAATKAIYAVVVKGKLLRRDDLDRMLRAAELAAGAGAPASVAPAGPGATQRPGLTAR
ncbi:MAG TPA: amidohydrolase family protein [Candidatus Cryosericum sp.]|nr:amidohydrolase family protein [Candidatus Cryosericum sp.]